MARRDPQEAPYQLSRAALRNAYGARRIDASAPQSPLDTTPSGRAAYLAQSQNIPLSQGQAQQAQEFKDQFKFQLDTQPRMISRSIVQNPQVKQPLPIDQSYQGDFAPEPFTLAPKPLGLLPTTAPAEEMSPFMPTTVGPLDNFSLPKIPKTFLGQPIPGASRFG